MASTVTFEPDGDGSVADAVNEALAAATSLKREIVFKLRGIDVLVQADDTLESVCVRFARSLPAAGKR